MRWSLTFWSKEDLKILYILHVFIEIIITYCQLMHAVVSAHLQGLGPERLMGLRVPQTDQFIMATGEELQLQWVHS